MGSILRFFSDFQLLRLLTPKLLCVGWAYTADNPNFFDLLALPWARAQMEVGNVAATTAVQSHDEMAHLQAEHQKANRTFNKTASYKGKPEAKKEADRLKDG